MDIGKGKAMTDEKRTEEKELPASYTLPDDAGEGGPSSVIKKILVIGDSGVGKKTIVGKIAPFIRDLMAYTERIGTAVTKYKLNYASKELDVDLMIMIWDVTGKPQYQHLYESYYRGAEGVVVMCDAGNDESIENVPLWIKAAFDFCGFIPLVVVINKVDTVSEARRKAVDKHLRTMVHKWDPPIFYTARDHSFERLKLPFYALADLVALRFMDQMKKRRFRKANIKSVVRDKSGADKGTDFEVLDEEEKEKQQGTQQQQQQ